jgi:hypothetical protein
MVSILFSNLHSCHFFLLVVNINLSKEGKRNFFFGEGIFLSKHTHTHKKENLFFTFSLVGEKNKVFFLLVKKFSACFIISCVTAATVAITNTKTEYKNAPDV